MGQELVNAGQELDALAAVVDLLDGIRVDFWLAGGWAVDFHHGEVTRSHSDIDIVILHSDRTRIHEALLAGEFDVTDDSDPDAEVIYQKEEIKLDVSLITVRPDGTVVTPGWEQWPWPPGSFLPARTQLSTVRAKLVSAETLLYSKSEWANNTGEAMRPRDEADIGILQLILRGGD